MAFPVKMEKERKYLLLNWILLIGYGCINLFAFYSSAYSWPTQGSVIWFLLIIFCPPFLYHLLFISYVFILKKRPHWKKIYRFITLLCGILLAGGLLQITQHISFTRFKTAYNPMMAEISSKMPSPCNSHYFALPAIADYNRSVNQKILQQNEPASSLFYNSQRFVMQFQAGSVDRDNSTIFYDSETKNWHFFHNEKNLEKQKLAERIKGLIACKNL